MTRTDDVAPLPLTYGEFDRRNARWSPDGKRIAYISNEDGYTSVWVQEVFGGARVKLDSSIPLPQKPGHVVVQIMPQDSKGNRISARISVLASDRRWYAPSQIGCTATNCMTARSGRAKSTTFTAPPHRSAAPW